MADAPKPDAKLAKYEPPKELEQKAAVQKFQGRPKRQPVDQAEYFYKVKTTHIVFFLSSLGMLVSFIMMFWKDFDRPWKPYQRQFAQMDFEKLWYEMNELQAKVKVDEDKIKVLDSQISAFLSKFKEAGEKGREFDVNLFAKDVPPVPGLEEKPFQGKVHVTADEKKQKLVVEEKEKIRGDHFNKQMLFNFAKDDLGALRFQYEEAKHHFEDAQKSGSPRLKFYEEHYRPLEKKWADINKRVADRKADFDRVDKLNTWCEDFGAALEQKPIPGVWENKKPLDELKKEKAKIRKELEEKEVRFAREKPSLANKIRNAPGADFISPTEKVRQQILPDLKDQLNFTKIEKVDRCHTCHIGIDNPNYVVTVNPDAEQEVDKYTFKDPFLRLFVAHARGSVPKEQCKVCDEKGRKDAEIKAPLTPHNSWGSDEQIKFTKTFMAHPRLDLFVSDSSKHPLMKVGCTICHEGDGRDTDFTRVVHTPESRKEGQDWRRRHGTPYGDERYDWNYRELWDLPMFPTKFAQASCRRCHTDAVELDGGEKYVTGMKLLERAGCYGCHRVDTYQILEKDLKDPAIEQNRKSRRPGPPLLRIADKTSKDWAMKWIRAPREFRPTTRMPHFFQLSNTRHEVDKKPYPPVEVNGVRRSPIDDTIIASITEYIYSLSEKKPEPAPAGVQGDAERGELLVKQVGCTACHKTEETTPAQYRKGGKSHFLEEFGPNLSGVGSKMNRDWLYHWVKDPKRHFKDSSMPNLRLTEQEAMDVVEYLMLLKRPEWEKIAPPVVINPIRNGLILELLRKSMSDADAEKTLEGKHVNNERLPFKDLKTDEGRTLWLGRRMVTNFGCYSCHQLRNDGDPKEGGLEWEKFEGIGVELSGSQPFGSKHHDRLDFGFAADDGANHHGVKFKHSFTGEEVEAHVYETRHDWLANKLHNPRVFDGGKMASKPWDELLRMPWFDFSPYEIELLSTFVLSFTDHGVAGLIDAARKRPNGEEMAKYRGDRIVRENNCKACHRMSLDRFETDWTRKDEKDKTIQSWVTVEGRLGQVMSADDAERNLRAWGLVAPSDDFAKGGKTLTTYSWVSDHRTLTMSGAVNPESKFVYFDGQDKWYLDVQGGKVASKRLIRRHHAMEGGDLLPELIAFKKKLNEGDLKRADGKKFDEKWLDFMDPDNPSEFETRYPPMLRTQGVKTQAEWLYRFLKEPFPLRPPLAPVYPGAKALPDVNLRMPTFGFTDEEATGLTRWFAIRDHEPGKDVYPHTDFPERTEAALTQGKAALDKVGAVIKDTNIGCASCHYMGGQAPPGAVIKHAPDLALAEERLRPRWLYPWVDVPANIYPGTTMTSYDFKPIFQGQQAAGVKAAVEYLLNFKKLNAGSTSEPKK